MLSKVKIREQNILHGVSNHNVQIALSFVIAKPLRIGKIQPRYAVYNSYILQILVRIIRDLRDRFSDVAPGIAPAIFLVI